ncbi:hypothetical protein TNCV_186671 [Trichonephila clavipes]|nr:hypothetical protein TNCV_186671 [Trichonephila clavipes]
MGMDMHILVVQFDELHQCLELCHISPSYLQRSPDSFDVQSSLKARTLDNLGFRHLGLLHEGSELHFNL